MDAHVTLGSWPVPPVIEHLARVAHLEMDDLLQTFNMGIGFVLICEQEAKDDVMKHLEPYGAHLIGHIVRAEIIDAPGKVIYVNS